MATVEEPPGGKNGPFGDDDGDGIQNNRDPDSDYYQRQLQAQLAEQQTRQADQQARQMEQQTIALQEQTKAIQMQTVVTAVGFTIIIALLLAAVFIIARRKKEGPD